MEAAAQRARAGHGRLEESVVRPDRRHGGDARRRQRRGGHRGGQQRVVHRRVRGVRNRRVAGQRGAVSHAPAARRRVEPPVVVVVTLTHPLGGETHVVQSGNIVQVQHAEDNNTQTQRVELNLTQNSKHDAL